MAGVFYFPLIYTIAFNSAFSKIQKTIFAIRCLIALYEERNTACAYNTFYRNFLC